MLHAENVTANTRVAYCFALPVLCLACATWHANGEKATSRN